MASLPTTPIANKIQNRLVTIGKSIRWLNGKLPDWGIPKAYRRTTDAEREIIYSKLMEFPDRRKRIDS